MAVMGCGVEPRAPVLSPLPIPPPTHFTNVTDVEIFSLKNPQLREDINRKKVFFRALPESPKPPWPQFGQLGPLFSDVKNDVLRVWPKKNFDDDNDGCNDNYDDNYGNFDDDYDKHRKNCECCHHHSLFKGYNVNVNIVVLNCQKWNQCLKYQVSGHKSLGLFEGVL